MRLYLLMVGVIVVLLLPIAVQSQEPNKKPLYQPTGLEATASGTVTLSGKVPQPTLIDMSADPVCVEISKDSSMPWALVNGNRLQGALVYVKKADILDSYSFKQDASDVVLDHKECRFLPAVQVIRVGQRLIVNNLDMTHHNTHPIPASNVEWNQTQPPRSEPLVKTFQRSEVAIPFKCNQHPWERAYIAVLNHPFFAITDELGNFQISGLPPGKYIFAVWHPKFRSEIEVTLIPGELRRLDFELKVEEATENGQRVYRP